MVIRTLTAGDFEIVHAAFLEAFRARYAAPDVNAWIERAQPLRALVIGETIIDEYQYCDSIGKSSKAAALVAKSVSSERFAGGIVAVANNVASVCDQVTLVSQLGAVASHEDFVRTNVRDRVRRRNGPQAVECDPSPLVPRPSPLAPRPSPLAPRPSSLFPFPFPQ